MTGDDNWDCLLTDKLAQWIPHTMQRNSGARAEATRKEGGLWLVDEGNPEYWMIHFIGLVKFMNFEGIFLFK